MLANVPGLQVLVPGSPADVYHLLRWAILESQAPTSLINHSLLFTEEEDFDPDQSDLPFGRARTRRSGDDVTVVASSIMVPRAIQAAEIVARDQRVEVEVVDLRTLSLLDRGTMIRSVRKTGRAVIADECNKSFGAGAELAATLAEEAFSDLRAPVRRVVMPDTPIPYSPPLEAELIVTSEKIVEGIMGVLGR